MATCLRCNKEGSFFKPLKLQDGYCSECFAIITQEKQQAEEKARKLEQEKQQQERLLQLKELMKPADPPSAQGGFVLAYSYTDVEFNCPEELKYEAQKVPPRKQITLHVSDDPTDKDVELWYEEVKLGTMKDNKLRDMVLEFAFEEKKEVLPATRYWTDKPIFSLFFYLSVDEFFDRWKKNPTFKKIRLVSNTNEEMQSNIALCHVGSLLTLEYDYDKDKYLVSDGWDIGYLPNSADDYITEYSDIEARIFELSETNSGKTAVTIAMVAKD